MHVIGSHTLSAVGFIREPKITHLGDLIRIHIYYCICRCFLLIHLCNNKIYRLFPERTNGNRSRLQLEQGPAQMSQQRAKRARQREVPSYAREQLSSLEYEASVEAKFIQRGL